MVTRNNAESPLDRIAACHDPKLPDPREYLKLKYMGECKCGNCQLVPPEMLEAWARELDALRSAALPKPAENTSREASGLFFEPSGDGMGACIHDANGAIICEAKYDDFESDPSYPERVMKQLIAALQSPNTGDGKP